MSKRTSSVHKSFTVAAATALILTPIAISSCKSDSAPKGRPASHTLRSQDAKERAPRVGEVSYDLTVHLNEEAPDFGGTMIIRFNYKGGAAPLTVDFSGGTIERVAANGAELPTVEYNGFYLSLPGQSLKSGPNEVEIAFKHPYSTNGSGLYRFKDPEDEKVYVYSDFEPYDSNRVFPGFDQPDIKATYTLKVTAPPSWKVVSASAESSIEDETSSEGKARKAWHFPQTLRMSTYVFPLHAGPFRIWTDTFKTENGAEIPLRLMVRQSLGKYVSSKEWFTITKQGFGFYQDYFDLPYPFGKYDQIIVPDFNSGAMENVGAVTFSERYVSRGSPTDEEREGRAEVILHEMAHMWFGNLVTMEWWDDLWLNESFATYMAYLSLAEATEFKEAWRSFYSDTKQWAYWEDQLVTTHPIVAKVPDTSKAFANFDGITYGKGASALKQLSFLLGPRTFRDGVRRYFKQHAFKNATMSDFISALEGSQNGSLESWTRSWLRTEGLNEVTVEYTCDDGKISRLALLQSADREHPVLREHRTQIGLYYREDDKIQMKRAHQVTYKGPSTPVAHLVGEPCPELVYPNHGDFDFVKVKLDQKTLKALPTSLTAVEDPLQRMMLWRSLWDMVRDAELSAIEVGELIMKILPSEKDVKIAAMVSEWIPSILHYIPNENPKDRIRRETFVEASEKFFWDLLKDAPGGSDMQKLWYDRFATVARSSFGIEKLHGILKGRITVRALDLDQDRRWALVRQLNRFDPGNSEGLIHQELKRDTGEEGQKGAIAATVVRPVLSTKTEWYKKISAEQTDLPFARIRVAMSNLFPSEQNELAEKFADQFFADVARMEKTKEEVFLRSFARSLVPATCTEKSGRRLQDFLDGNEELNAVALKALRVAHQEDERCVKIRARSREGAQSTAGL